MPVSRPNEIDSSFERIRANIAPDNPSNIPDFCRLSLFLSLSLCSKNYSSKYNFCNNYRMCYKGYIKECLIYCRVRLERKICDAFNSKGVHLNRPISRKLVGALRFIRLIRQNSTTFPLQIEWNTWGDMCLQEKWMDFLSPLYISFSYPRVIKRALNRTFISITTPE